MRRLAILVLVAVLAGWPHGAQPADAVPTENDPVTAARVVKLTEKLRCLVCQNQTIADSNADLAADLRRQIREQVAAGKTDEEILAYMTARYGDFVLYEPPFKATTVLLWTGPALLLVIGFTALARSLSARKTRTEAPPLTDDERERAARLLGADGGKDIA